MRFVPSPLKGSSWHGGCQKDTLLSQAFERLCRDMAVPVLVPPDLNPLRAERWLLQHLRRRAVESDTAGQDNGTPTESSLSEAGM